MPSVAAREGDFIALLVVPLVVRDDRLDGGLAQVKHEVFIVILTDCQREVIATVVDTGFGVELHGEGVTCIGKQAVRQLRVLAATTQ